jgi:ATP-binding cassette subfamily B (MDR/TAP) protein 1
MVEQEPVLFRASIERNIALGKEGSPATTEEVIAAAKSANIHDFIMSLPKGYGTVLGEGGSAVSGGQKQRLAIARAIIRDPSIFLLDEATAALDNESERIVQEALDKLLVAKKHTTIVIAHRLSTIVKCDKIFVMNEGRVIESGTHDELLKIEGGKYKSMIELQELGKDNSTQAPLKVRDITLGSDDTVTSSGETKPHEVNVDITSVDGTEKSLSVKSPTSAEKTIISPEAQPKKSVVGKDSGFSKRLYLTAKPEWGWVLCGAIASACAGAVMPLFALIFSEMLKVFFEPDNAKLKKESSFWALMFLAIGVFMFFAVLVQLTSFEIIGQRLARRLRQMAFRKLLTFEMSYFDEPENSTGAISTRLLTDASKVSQFVGAPLGLMLQAIASLSVGLGIAFWTYPKMTGVLLAAGNA